MNAEMKVLSKRATVAVLAVFAVSPVFAAPGPVLSLTLREARDLTNDSSAALKAAESLRIAAAEQAKAASSPNWPRLSLEAGAFHQSNVPRQTFFPGVEIAFGTHKNYSFGPMLTYTLIDGGQTRGQARAAAFLAKAREADAITQKRQLEYLVKVTYFRAQLTLRNLTATAASLRLAQAQGRDISLRVKAGGASRLDKTMADKETLGYRMKFSQAQSDLSDALADLLALTGEQKTYDLSRPASAELAANLPADVPPASVRVALDPLEISRRESAEALRDVPSAVSPDLPQLKSLIYSAEAARETADSESSGYWPKIQIYAKSERIYPNFVLPEEATNNVLGVNLSLPLFEGGLTPRLSAQKRAEAASADFLRRQKLRDLERDRAKAADLLAQLEIQRRLSEENVGKSEEIARLTYQAYRAGRGNYLDVQTANLRRLEAELTAAGIESNALAETAALQLLSVTKGDSHE